MIKKIPVWLIVILALVIIVTAALWLRMALPYSQVFVGDWVKLTGVDTYYSMRLVDNLVKHFPNLTQFDPYNIFPGGAATNKEPDFFVYLISGVVWLLGLGKPDQHFTDLISVYIPPVLAALTIIGSFFIGNVLKNVWTGLLAAGLLAILPGEFLNRSLLGYTDYHIAETMFTTFFILFVMLAFTKRKSLDPSNIKEKEKRSLILPVVYSLCAGIALALYMLTWAGAALFILILFAFLVLQIIADYSRGRSAIPTGIFGVIILLTALVIYLPGGRSPFSLIAIIFAIAVTVILSVIAWIMQKRNIKTRYYLLTVVALGVIGAISMYFIDPGTFALMIDRLVYVFGWKPDTTILEMQPLLLYRGDFTPVIAWGNFTIGLILGIAGLILLVYNAVKKPKPTIMLMLVWTFFILLATLAMRRFAYYFAVNIALLSGFFAYWILELLGFGRKRAEPEIDNQPIRTKAARIKAQKLKRAYQTNPVLMSCVLVIVLAVMIYPNTGPLPGGAKPSIDLATRPLFAPSDAWCQSLDWLRENTPEPLGDPSAYYDQYRIPGVDGGFVYPSSAYGVLSWWDYGYWITRIGRRIPFSNPGTNGIMGEAKFFLAQDEALAGQSIKEVNIRYVIVDDTIASYQSKFAAITSWIGGSYTDYYDLFIQKQGEKYSAVLAFFPEYYQTMVVRMYNFDGKEVVPDEVTAISYTPMQADDGNTYNTITDSKQFSTYEEAVEFVNSKEPGSYRIVGQNPYKSPVPLKALKNYKLAYSSPQNKTELQVINPYIKIFEYQH
jgi:oligosaccharyl transferase (archaeosortase A-associated)